MIFLRPRRTGMGSNLSRSANLLLFGLIVTASVYHASEGYKWPCIPGWYPYRNHCYLVYPPPEKTEWFTFDAGEEFCQGFRNKQGKGHLVSILDQEEQDFVTRLMSKIRPERPYAIGLTDAAVEGVFKWTDGSVLSYTNWGADQPDANLETEDYVEMKEDGTWNDEKGGSDPKKSKEKLMCKMTQFAKIRNLTDRCHSK